MNESMYRAGPTAGGLPLPRARLGAFTVAVAIVSVLAAIMPWLLLFGGGASGAWMTFRNGGIGMWFLALLDFMLPIALGIAGAVVVRGKRVPSGLFFGVAVIPLVVSLFFGYLALKVVDGALSGGAIDPSQAMRINAAGLSEALSLDIFGGFVTCGSAIIGAVALAGAVGSIDVGAATRADAERPSAALGAASLVAAAAWFVATIVLTAVRIKVAGAIALCVVLVVGVLVPFVVLAARSAPVLRRWHDAVEARRAAGALLVGGLAGLLAVLVLERAIAARVASQVFDAISSGDGVSAGQRARILMDLVDARRWASIAYGIHAVLGATTFGLALAGAVGPARGGGAFRHPVSPSTVMAASVGIFVMAAVFALGVGRARSTERIAAMRGEGAPKGITLPLVDLDMNDARSASDGTITLRADGTAEPGERVSNLVCLRRGSVKVFADRMATLEMLSKRLPDMSECSLGVVFAVATERDRGMEARLGDLAPFVRGDEGSIATAFESSFVPTRPSSGSLTVRALADETIQYEGRSVKLPLGPSAPSLDASRYELVRYVFQPADSIGHVIRVIVAMRQRFGSNLAGATTSIAVAWPPKPNQTTPWAAENANLPSGIRFQTPLVSGRLTPESIARVVKQNAGRIRACYGEGLERDPKLAGVVRVKLVIGATGAVVTAQDAASTLPDREVVSCIVRAVGSLTFAQPEGGIVIVTYPMTLAP